MASHTRRWGLPGADNPPGPIRLPVRTLSLSVQLRGRSRGAVAGGPDRLRAKSTSIGHLSPTTRTAPSHGTRELPPASPPARTFTHVRDSDATLWGGDTRTPEARATIETCHQLSRSCLRVEDGFTRPSHGEAWIVAHEVRVLNVAGNRASNAQGDRGGRGDPNRPGRRGSTPERRGGIWR